MDSSIRVDWNFVWVLKFVMCAVYFAHLVLVSLSTRYYSVQSSLYETNESVTEHF